MASGLETERIVDIDVLTIDDDFTVVPLLARADTVPLVFDDSILNGDNVCTLAPEPPPLPHRPQVSPELPPPPPPTSHTPQASPTQSRVSRNKPRSARFDPSPTNGGDSRWGTGRRLANVSALGFIAFAALACALSVDDVRQEQARSFLDGPDRQPTIAAMESEYLQVCDRGTFISKLVSRVELRALNVLTLKWVIKEKFRDDGTREKIKARLVVRGFAQRYGVDYHETFAPTARVDTVRQLVAWATAVGFSLYSGDVTGAYLYGDLEETVYTHEPQGFASPPRLDGLLRIWLLLKSLYGLKQAGRMWHQIIHNAFLSFGFKRSNVDPCLYVLHRGCALLVCALYVDNLIAATSQVQLWLDFVIFCCTQFELVDLGPLRFELGVVFERGLRLGATTMTLSQGPYIRTLVKRFDVLRYPSRQTLCDKSLLRLPTDADPRLGGDDMHLYRQVTGSFVWLAWWTRIDIVYVVVFLCTYMHDPREYHLNVAYQILAYLSETPDIGLTYVQGFSEPIGFCDASWVTSWTQEAQSVVGGVIFYAGAASQWVCEKTKEAMLSSVESEVVGTWAIVPHIISCHQFFTDVGAMLTLPTVLYIDSQGTVSNVLEPVISKKNKHIRAKYWRARQETLAGTIFPVKIDGSKNVANYLTKLVEGSNAIRDRRVLMNIV